MIEIDLLLRIAIAFLKDMNLEDFKKLVYETEFLLSDINNFETKQLPKDSPNKQGNLRSPLEKLTSEFSITSPRYEAEILLGHILNMTRVQLHVNAKKEITDFDKQRYFKLLAMRKNGVPVEYLTNQVNFFSLDFYVDQKVLIPRPETEILVEKALLLIKEKDIPNFIEVGVGSGAVSAAILKNTESTHAVAIDISKEALNIAKYNMQRLEVDNRVEFIESDLLSSPHLFQQSVQLVISNPPYIANDYPLNQEVLCEPHIALFGGEKGDEILKKLIWQAKDRNVQYLLCEMGYDQKASMQKVLSDAGYNAEFYQDHAGFDRGFLATLIIQ